MEDKLKIFIDSIIFYFDRSFEEPVQIGSPYLVDSFGEFDSEYTGLISVSGEYEGICCFFTPEILLKKVIAAVGVDDFSPGMLVDTAGEIANTLSGNARKHLGENFNISVPIVFKGTPDPSYFPVNAKMYAIPLELQGNKATLGVCLVQ